jgi:hypothetical protein
MEDGLYQVITRHFCAGFVVEDGRVTLCAPILKPRLDYWMTIARRISDEADYYQLYSGQRDSAQ